MHTLHSDRGIGLVVVGFSPPDRLAAVAGHLGWTGRVLSDPDRLLYERLGIGRAPWWRVYSPGTMAVYARAILRGQHLAGPEEDTRQLGGDVVMAEGKVVVLWRPRSPDDRPRAAEVLAAAHSAKPR